MNILSKFYWMRLLGLLLLICCASLSVHAEPYLAVKTGQKCSSCHVNPIGGGLRSTYGNVYGFNQLAAKVSDFTSAEIGQISEFIGLGGNLRYNGEHSSDDAGNTTSGFRIDSAQIYMAINVKNSPLTLYLDQQVAPGAAVNREAFALYRFNSGHYIKAGKMFVPYGLRLEDDSAFVRQVTGFNFDSSDNGLELGLEYTRTTVNLFVTNGTTSVSNNDKEFQYGARVEHLFDGFRVGSTALINSHDSGEQIMYNLYGGFNWGDFTFLAEVDWINTGQDQLEDKKQLVGLLEVNYQVQQGLNLKLTSEYYDPDTDFGHNQETRLSLIVEYTPISNLQFRAGIRSSDSIPQLPERSVEKIFIQGHVYF